MNELTVKETMSSLQIAEISGKSHKDVMRAIRKMEKAWVSIGRSNFALSYYINSQNKQQPCYELTKVECLYIATKFNDVARAKLVASWEQLEEERQVRQAELNELVSAKITMVKAYRDLLNINDASTAKMLNTISAEVGAPLLDYVPSKGVVKSATELLKKNGIIMSASSFNRLAEEKGYLETKTRPSRNGYKKFRSITNLGLEYGENQVSPNNPKETQPLWYENCFMELYYKVVA